MFTLFTAAPTTIDLGAGSDRLKAILFGLAAVVLVIVGIRTLLGNSRRGDTSSTLSTLGVVAMVGVIFAMAAGTAALATWGGAILTALAKIFAPA